MKITKRELSDSIRLKIESIDEIESNITELTNNKITLDELGKIPSSYLNIDTSNLVSLSSFNSHADNKNVHVTESEKATWNAKSNFSGSYADLTNKPTSFTPASHSHTIADVQNLQTELNSRVLSSNLISTESTKGASLIGVNDANNLFTATNVEGALTELFTYANNGKTEIAEAITNKGVEASPSDTFPVLANKVGQISTGKKFATGTTKSTGSSIDYVSGSGSTTASYSVEVAGLGFTPEYILIQLYKSTSANEMFVLYDSTGSFLGSYKETKIVQSMASNNGKLDANYGFKLDGTSAYAINGSFRLPIGLSAADVKWTAFGS